MVIDKIKLPGCIYGCTGDGKEAVFEFLYLRARCQRCECIGHWRSDGLGRNVENCELTLAYIQMMRHIFNCILIREFADSKKCAAAIVIADGISALGIYMHVAKMNI